MRRFLSTTLLILLASSVAGCRFLSSDDVVEPFFDLSVNDVELSGSSGGEITDGELHIRAELMYPDSTLRFLEFTVADFDGEGVYSLPERGGTYGAILEDDERSPYGFASGRPEDLVAINGYDSGAGIVRGSVFFFSQSVTAFDGVERGAVFSVSGRFRTEL